MSWKRLKLELLALVAIVCVIGVPDGVSRTKGSNPAVDGVDSTDTGLVEPDEKMPTASPPRLSIPGNGVRTGVKSGRVTVESGAPAYAVGAEIVVYITNGLLRPIYAEDMKTQCSILILERRTGKVWIPLMNCGMERMPIVVTIPAGEEYRVKIEPRSSSFGEELGLRRMRLAEGTYRFRFQYSLQPSPQGSEPECAFSRELSLSR